jgi:hypothetical protein
MGATIGAIGFSLTQDTKMWQHVGKLLVRTQQTTSHNLCGCGLHLFHEYRYVLILHWCVLVSVVVPRNIPSSGAQGFLTAMEDCSFSP